MQVRLSDDGQDYIDDAGERYVRVSRVLSATGCSRQYFDDGGRARTRGSAVHLACQFIDENRLAEESLDPQISGYVQAYRVFRSSSSFRPVGIEIALGSIHGFAGTIDRVGMLNGRLVIVDLKTGESIDPAVEYQTGAYEVLWNEDHPSQLIQARFALQLKRNGRYKLHPMAEPASEFLNKWDEYRSISSAPRPKEAIS